ncbi:MAG: hypothetical protein M3063_02315 [Actinomycetota bacterium]|nr:hypothetical protein [Actinomycetota bacterium]
MDVLQSAFRHGIDWEDTQHAVRNAVVVEEVAMDPTRYLVSVLTVPGTCSKWS